MKRPLISVIAAVALLATTITLLWSHTPSTKLSAGTAPMPSLQELHTAANANKLPNQEIEDQSLIFQAWRSARCGRMLIEPTRTVSGPMSIKPSGEPAAIVPATIQLPKAMIPAEIKNANASFMR